MIELDFNIQDVFAASFVQAMSLSLLSWELEHKVFRGWWSMLFYDCEDSGTAHG